MSTVLPGDIVVCKIRLGKIVNAYSDEWEETAALDIICICDNGYLVKIRGSLFLHNSFIITKKDLKEFKIPNQFIDCIAHFIVDTHILSIKQKLTGSRCIECDEFFDYADPNHPDGTFICWGCKNYRFYK